MKRVLVICGPINEDGRRLMSAAVALGYDAIVARRAVLARLPSETAIAFYGLRRHVAIAAAFLQRATLEPPLDWLTTLPFEYRQRRIGFGTFAEAQSLTYPLFLKPADSPDFPSQVYGAPPTNIPADTVVLWAEPVTWEVEVRAFLEQRRLVQLVGYREWSATEHTATDFAAARAFVERAVTDERIILPPATVLDVGRIAERGWAVVEVNPITSAGLYRADAQNILPLLFRAVRRRDELTAEELGFVIARSVPPRESTLFLP